MIERSLDVSVFCLSSCKIKLFLKDRIDSLRILEVPDLGRMYTNFTSRAVHDATLFAPIPKFYFKTEVLQRFYRDTLYK